MILCNSIIFRRCGSQVLWLCQFLCLYIHSIHMNHSDNFEIWTHKRTERSIRFHKSANLLTSTIELNELPFLWIWIVSIWFYKLNFEKTTTFVAYSLLSTTIPCISYLATHFTINCWSSFIDLAVYFCMDPFLFYFKCNACSTSQAQYEYQSWLETDMTGRRIPGKYQNHAGHVCRRRSA